MTHFHQSLFLLSTGIHLVPVSSWTMELQGSKHVAIAGATDKRQITATFCGTAMGEFLPIQLIYGGKTARCHSRYEFPGDWSITHTPKHWSNKSTMLEYMDDIIVPYIKRVREDLGLGPEQVALGIFDHFKGQMTDEILRCLEKHNIRHVLIPTSCMAQLQPMDVSVNRAAKVFLDREFQEWYAKEIVAQLKTSDELFSHQSKWSGDETPWSQVDCENV